MNMISIANFDSFDKTAGFLPKSETEEPAADFSALLGSISVTMQTADLALRSTETRNARGETVFSLEIQTGPPTAKNEPADAALQPPTAVPPADPADNGLWAGFPPNAWPTRATRAEIDPETRVPGGRLPVVPPPPVKTGADIPGKLDPGETPDIIVLTPKIKASGDAPGPTGTGGGVRLPPEPGDGGGPVRLPPEPGDGGGPVRLPPEPGDFVTGGPVRLPPEPGDFVTGGVKPPPGMLTVADRNVRPPLAAPTEPAVKTVPAVPFPDRDPLTAVALGGETDLPPTMPDRPAAPLPVLTPKFDGGRLKGFDLTPTEVNSIIRSFDRFLAEPARTAAVVSEPAAAVFREPAAAVFREPAQPARLDVGTLVKNIAASNTAHRRANERSGFAPLAELPPTPAPLPAEPARPSFLNGPPNFPAAAVRPSAGIFAPRAERAATAPVETVRPAETPTPTATPAATAELPTFELIRRQVAAEISATPLAAARNDGRAATETTAPAFEDFDPDAGRRTPETLAALDRTAERRFDDLNVEPAERPDAARRVFEQIADPLLEAAALAVRRNEKQTLKMRLHPAELGAVEIRLERTDAGTLNAHFQTETDGARQALAQNVEQLRDSLQNAGFDVGRMEFSFSPGGSTADHSPQHSPRDQQSRPNDAGFAGETGRRTASSDDSSPNASDRLVSLLA